ncbi:unnamed protein product [Rhodiola kirilowii]
MSFEFLFGSIEFHRFNSTCGYAIEFLFGSIEFLFDPYFRFGSTQFPSGQTAGSNELGPLDRIISAGQSKSKSKFCFKRKCSTAAMEDDDAIPLPAHQEKSLEEQGAYCFVQREIFEGLRDGVS